MKKIITVGLILFLTTFIKAQVQPLGIVKEKISGLNIGDTVTLLNIRKNITSSDYDKYYIYVNYVGSYVKANKIELIDNNLTFWENAWFNSCSEKIHKNGWQEDRREALAEDAFNYFKQSYSNDLIYEDEFLYDYLYQLLSKIHPERLIKTKEENLKILVIKSQDQEYFSFDNGMIVLTTGLLANSNTEEDLVKVLVECVSHVVFEHNLTNMNMMLRAERNAQIWGTIATVASSALMVSSNINNGTNFNFGDAAILGMGTYFVSRDITESIGANYSSTQVNRARNIAVQFIENDNWEFISDNDYLSRISDVLSYSAKHSFQLMNYNASINFLDKLYENGLSSENDLLLRSKLYRVVSNTEESNRKALEIIFEAQGLGLINVNELFKEEALIQLRLNEKDNAKLAFEKYREGLLDLDIKNEEVKKEVEMIDGIIFKYGL